MTNLHAIVVPLQTAVPHLTKFLTKSHRVIYKRKKKTKNFNEKEGNKREGQKYCHEGKEENSKCQIQTIKQKEGNLDIHKNKYCHQPNAHFERTQSTFNNTVMRKRNKIVLFSDVILKNLRMGEFNSFMKKGEVSLKSFPGPKARQSNRHTILFLENNTFDAAAIHVVINHLLSNVKSINDIWKDIDIGLRCRNNNIGIIFISSIAHSSKVNPASNS